MRNGKSATKTRKNVCHERRRNKPSQHRLRHQQQVLLLQGPVGPFFKHLQRRLDQNGLDAWRVSFNPGDRLFSRAKRIDFTGDLHEWGRWLETRLTEGHVCCIILFGCMRPVHVVARRLAEKAGVAVLSLEEGYLRPGFVTVERMGNNAASPIAGTVPTFAASSACNMLPMDFRPSRVKGCYGALYYAVASYGSCSERELLHRRYSPVHEAFYWARNYWRYHSRRRLDQVLAGGLLNNYSGNYFVVPLQVAGDGQMAHGCGWTSHRLVEEVLKSFARVVPVRQHLVFKVHPLERGHSNTRYEVLRLAALLGVEHRVHVIETGALGPLIQHSAGVITINSTSGFSAIFHGVPLLVIGDAVYSHPRLAVCAGGDPDFDAFWHCKHVAESNLRQNYLDGLKAACLKPGDFYCRSGIALACTGVIERLAEIIDRTSEPIKIEREAVF